MGSEMCIRDRTKEVFVSINDEVSPACIFSDETNQEKQKAIIMPMRV